MTAVAERTMVHPAYVHIPERTGSMVAEVTALAASVDRIFDEEQRFAVDVLTSTKADLTPATLAGAVICARQNLKTYVLECIALAKLVDPRSRDGVLGIWSAQQFDTAQETFRNFEQLFENYSHLTRRVKKITRGDGKEEIELIGDRRLKFKSRSRSGGRGLSGDFTVLDEAYALQSSHMGALLPTLSTKRRAHVLYGSSAGLADSAVLRSVRDRGRPGGRGAPAYVEWCAPDGGCAVELCDHAVGTPGCALDDEGRWLLANPALGRRITYEYLRDERNELDPLEFARERLGWWDDPTGESPIPLAAWIALTDRGSRIVGPLVMALDVSPGQHSAAVAVAGWRSDGSAHVEVIEHRFGTGWLVEYLGQRFQAHRPTAVVGHGTAQLRGLVPGLAQAGVLLGLTKPGKAEPTGDPLTDSEMASACSLLQAEVAQGRIRHIGQQQLSDALGGAARRDAGDGGWLWRRKSSEVDIAPLVAVTAARWGLQTVPRPSAFFAARR